MSKKGRIGMELPIQTMLLYKYGLNPSTNFKLLNDGENKTYVNLNKEIIIRQYRPFRFSREQIYGEIAWLQALGEKLSVAEVLLNKDNEAVTTINTENQQLHFVGFKYISGNEIEAPCTQDYEKLGQTLLSIHESSDKILRLAKANWLGFKRPTYDDQRTITESMENLCNADFLTSYQKERSIKVAETIQRLVPRLGERQFVHGDLHFGNIINENGNWHVLDFDECGFGYKGFDIGVPRMHLIATNQLDEKWNYFKNGYNKMPDETVLRGGTALRILYMTGKLPNRLDIEHIRENPGRFVDRYLDLIEKELAGETIV